MRGDRVAIYLNSSIEAVITIFAVLKAGGVFVFVDHTIKRDKLAYILNNCQAVALLADASAAPMTDAVHTEVASLRQRIFCGKQAETATAARANSLSFDSMQAAFSADLPACTNIDRDLACLIYTSGSTGFPKGVMSDHSSVVFAAESIIEYLENIEDDIVIDVLLLSFDCGLHQLLMVFKFGGTLVLEHGFAYPAAALKRMESECVTGLPCRTDHPRDFAAKWPELLRPVLSALYQQYRRIPAASTYPEIPAAFPRCAGLLHVRLDGNQAHAVPATRSVG